MRAMSDKGSTRERRRPLRWPVIYGAALLAFTAYVLLDAFVIPRSYSTVQKAGTTTASGSSAAGASSDSATGATTQASATTTTSTSTSTSAAQVTDTSYVNGGTSIAISTYRDYDTTYYVADIQVSSGESLLTALANDTYGKNVTQTTSAMAQANDAILAINGDFYGTRNGYVIRNGVLYRSTSAGSDQQDLVIYSDGTFEVVSEGDVTAQELLDKGAWQVLSFGPALVEDGQVSVSTSEEVDKAMTTNPRTAIGIIDTNHYVFVVADGRTSESTGMSLYELAECMQQLGVKTAYNLDGGGSSTMVFNGTVVNNPTTNGDSISERKVSDIVYVAA